MALESPVVFFRPDFQDWGTNVGARDTVLLKLSVSIITSANERTVGENLSSNR